MRDKNYRRKQEAKHYKKRINGAIARGKYKVFYDEDGNKLIIPLSDYKAHQPWIYKTVAEKALENNRYKRWKFALKNDSFPTGISTWVRRYCRRNHRHFQKQVDYIIPDRRFLVRASVYPRDLV